MPSREDILSDLPAPNADEPGALRRDILDELADHLECAARREALSHPDPQEAQRRVLARFGDPRKIARQLWFEAMKEKLMLQKLTLALVTIVAVGSALACGFMLSLARDFQAASSELLSQSREANEALLAELRLLTNRKGEPPSYLDWIPLKVQILKNDDRKSPGEGFNVNIEGHALTETDQVIYGEKTNAEGIAEFGVVRPGPYQARVYAPWGDTLQTKILVKPGSPYTAIITAPAGPPKEIPVKPAVKWPKALEGAEVAVLVTVSPQDATQIDQFIWQRGHGIQVLFRPDGRFAICEGQQSHVPSPPPNLSWEEVRRLEDVQFFGKPIIYKETFPFRGRDVVISDLKIVKLSKDADFPGMGESLPCLYPSFALERLLSQPPPGGWKSAQVCDKRQICQSRFAISPSPRGRRSGVAD